MSDEDGNLLLEPEKRSLASFLLPAALAVGGAALIYSKSKKADDKKSSGSSAPDAGSNEVVFATNYGSFTIGDDYEQIQLESYLAEQAEDGNLQIPGETGELFAGIEGTLVVSTRSEVIAAFRSTHKVKVGDERVLISSLPGGKTGVVKFNEWLFDRVKHFQENY
jgi:hypothetical protein